jgi:hypothetical protein
MDLAEKEGIEIHFNHKCTNINWNTNEIVFETESDKKSNQKFSTCFLVPMVLILQPDYNIKFITQSSIISNIISIVAIKN